MMNLDSVGVFGGVGGEGVGGGGTKTVNWFHTLKVYYLFVCLCICMSYACQVVRAGLNIEIAPDLIANQLNVRNGALILQVYCCHC